MVTVFCYSMSCKLSFIKEAKLSEANHQYVGMEIFCFLDLNMYLHSICSIVYIFEITKGYSHCPIKIKILNALTSVSVRSSGA